MLSSKYPIQQSCSTYSSQNWSLGDAIEAMREFREKYPPSTIAVTAIVGTAIMREIQELGFRADSPTLGHPMLDRIYSINVECHFSAPPRYMEIEFADGHSEVWSPDGWYRMKETRVEAAAAEEWLIDNHGKEST